MITDGPAHQLKVRHYSHPQMRTIGGALILACAGMVYCNTEIVTLPRFPALELPVDSNPTWPLISTLPEQNSGLFEIHPIPLNENSDNSSTHDLWVLLEIDEWRKAEAAPDAFTLRLSWPASMAVDFDISIFRPPTPQFVSKATAEPPFSWLQYARLRAYSIGIRVPRLSARPVTAETARFNLILEPLLWGVIPRSVVPTLLSLFAAVGISSWLVPRVLPRLYHVAEEARAEADKKL